MSVELSIFSLSLSLSIQPSLQKLTRQTRDCRISTRGTAIEVAGFLVVLNVSFQCIHDQNMHAYKRGFVGFKKYFNFDRWEMIVGYYYYIIIII